MFSIKNKLMVKSSFEGKKVVSSFQQYNYYRPLVQNQELGQHKDLLLSGILSEQESLFRYYRDIYTYDVVAGSAVDLMSTMPFSDWSLTGAENAKLLVFSEAIERLNLKVLLPQLSIDYLVLGMFIGTLLYKSSVKKFTDIIIFRPEDCIITPSPIYGIDPVIRVNIPQEMRDFALSKEAHFLSVKERLNEHLLQSMLSKQAVLDPITTIYIPRKTYSHSLGTSIYKRILPIYLLEKILYRGTLIEATRRQRAISHIVAGDEEWIPTEDELRGIIALFQQADLDPIGAYVATRNNISVQEIKPGGDFWKYTDIIDITNQLKLRALGISESFLSGDATYNTMEASLSIFIEYIRSYRDMITRKIFYNKLFPTIAVLYDFYKETPQPITTSRTFTSPLEDFSYEIADTSKLIIPTVNWHKDLRPEADQDYLSVLQLLSDQGVPITLRMWAAAGGISLENIEEELQQDKVLRDKIKEIKGDKEKENYEDYSSVQGAVKRIGFLNRDFGDLGEAYEITKTGKKKYVYNQKQAHEKTNRRIVQALNNIREKNIRIKLRNNPYGLTE